MPFPPASSLPSTRAIGLGCMRLSTAPERDEDRGIAAIHAALDAGATLLDTADAYCHDEGDTGHNERLVAAALLTWPGDRSRVVVATKGGLRRPGGAWVTDARAKHLRHACERSARALGVERIDLYQLHAVDPKTPIATSVRALASLQRDGLVRHIGLCNVTVDQVEAACAIADIATVQVSLSVLDDESLRSGVAEYCRAHGIGLLAYRPLGGDRAQRLPRDPVLATIAEAHGATAAEVALAWLLDLGVVPVAGATRVETATSLGRALALELTGGDRERLDERFAGRLLRVPRDARRPSPGADGDIVIVMGMPGAGKSTISAGFEQRGYRRLNRDERGGSLAALIPVLDAGLASGERRWVLDNTYPSRRARNEVIECAWRHGVHARCIWLTTAIADAQVNAITRLVAAHGSLPMPEELRERGSVDPRYFGPDAQFRYERVLEAPTEAEGFASVERRAFHRSAAPDTGRRAVILEFDEVLGVSRLGQGPAVRPDELAIVPGRRAVLQRYADEGWLLFAHAWRPQVAAGTSSAQEVASCFDRARELLGLEVAIRACPHAAGPPVCWCRKPLPGLLLEFTLGSGVVLDRCISVGRAPADRTMAARLGMAYHEAAEFFGGTR